MRTLVSTLLLFAIYAINAQIWSNPITGTNPGASNPYTPGQSMNANVTVSGIGRGSGISAAPATNDRYNAINWDQNGLNPNDYFTFTLTPVTGGRINFASFSYTGQASAQGPRNFVFRSSLDAFMADIGTASATGSTISLSAAEFQHITSSIEFRLYGWNSLDANGTFSINDFSFNGAALLPVQLFSFTIIPNQNPILLWTTYSEVNNAYYSIERSRDGISFLEISRVTGHGTTNLRNEYSFVDPASCKGMNYYRIKQTDLDGSTSSFPLRSVMIPIKDIIVYPSIFEREVTLELPPPYDKRINWVLYDEFGRLVNTGLIVQSQPVQQLPLPAVNSGTYFLALRSDRTYSTHKLLKLERK